MYTVATGLLVGGLATSVISSHNDVVFGRSKCWAKVHQFELSLLRQYYPAAPVWVGQWN